VIYRYIASGNADGTVVKTGSGTWTLAMSYNGANGWSTGGLVVEDGTLKYGVDNAVPYGSTKGNVTVNGGTLDINGHTATINGLIWTAAR
jgi:hypothetical protein